MDWKSKRLNDTSFSIVMYWNSTPLYVHVRTLSEKKLSQFDSEITTGYFKCFEDNGIII